MATPLLTPPGELASLGFGKEATFGTGVAPTMWDAFMNFVPSPKNVFVPRGGARKRLSNTYPATGAYELALSVDPETAPDVFGQLLAFALGAQSAPVTGASVVATTFNGSTSIASPTTITVSTDTRNIFPGCSLLLDSAAQQETVVVISVTGPTTFTCNTTKTHASGQPITSPVATTAYTSLLTMGSPLPSFTTEYVINKIGTSGAAFARDYTGCKVDTLSLSMNSKGGLVPKFSLVGQSELQQGAPTTPVFSTKQIFTFQAPGAWLAFNAVQLGIQGAPAVISWDLSYSNNLLKAYESYGFGRTVYGFPEQQRKITGKLTLGFESTAQYTTFLGATTGPANYIPGIAMYIVCATTDLADATNNFPFSIFIKLPNLAISALGTPGKASGALQQDFTFEAAESTPGAADDIALQLLNTQTTAY
jgi:Phage tail tube protein